MPFPLSEVLLCHYVSFLAVEGLAHSSIKGYLSTVRHLQIVHGLPDLFAQSLPILELVLKGVKVSQGKKERKVTQKHPTIPSILRGICQFQNIMLWAAMSLCFFGFLHSGEITIPTVHAFDPSYHLTLGDVSVDSQKCPSIVVDRLKDSD